MEICILIDSKNNKNFFLIKYLNYENNKIYFYNFVGFFSE